MVDDINALQRLELKEAFDEFDKVRHEMYIKYRVDWEYYSLIYGVYIRILH